MKIKYVGPKPLISKTGISFDSQNDDRYTYLNITVQLLQALDHDYFEDRTYTYAANSSRLKDSDIVDILSGYCDDLERTVESAVTAEQRLIDDEFKRAEEAGSIAETEREALIKNIRMMEGYRLQYATNEKLYGCAIQQLARLVKRENIDYVIVPMFQRFAAVLHSIQDELSKQKFPIDTRMDIFEENGRLMAKMEVKNR